MSITVKDQLNRIVTISSLSDGIVSLVPSQTELLFELGLDELITGVTRFCIHPERARKQSTVIGGTKNPDLKKIEALKPGLILANKEENNREDIEYLSSKFPVWVSDVNNLDSAIEMITTVGRITGTSDAAEKMTDTITRKFESHKSKALTPALYLIWNEPMLAAGTNTFIDDMMRHAGFSNLASESRYPEVSPEKLSPEVVLLSSEPYPFTEKHIEKYKSLFPGASVILADGTYFSWYGSRLCKAPEYFSSLRQQLQAARHLLA